MNNQPKDPITEFRDKTLDSALASYTPAAPRFGFEERLKARMAAEAELARRPRFPLSLLWVGAAVIASVAGLLVLLHRPHAPSAPSTSAGAQHASPPQKHASVPRGPVDPARFYAGIKPQTQAPRPAVRAKEPVRPAMSAIDAVSYQEMRAASHPPPEEPLTQEEKLLLRIVHKGDPQEMAMLNPEIREKQDAQSEAEFNQFVMQSTKGHGE